MHILDYFTRGPSVASRRVDPLVGAQEEEDGAPRRRGQPVNHNVERTSHLTLLSQLYEKPLHASSRLTPSQGAASRAGDSFQGAPQAQQQPQRVVVDVEAVLSSPASVPAGADAVAALAVASGSPSSETAPGAPTVNPSAPEAAPSGPGLKDCRSRACDGVVDTFKRALRRDAPHVMPAAATGPAATAATGGAGSSQQTERDGQDGGTGVAATSGGSGDDVDGGGVDRGCPPDTWELGRATWTFLHSVAAHYPDQPSPRQQELMRGMMDGVAEFYPCEVCAEHLREQVRDNPPRVATARDLNLWLCGIHNEVNDMLGRPLFDCNRIAERWRDGPPDGSCD